ncbi:hypothetical protein J6590_024745 [Homalodisca vitripennis]|nr:hypothetical protein J6590_024745 [Homalodisca vitripennis]
MPCPEVWAMWLKNHAFLANKRKSSLEIPPQFKLRSQNQAVNDILVKLLGVNDEELDSIEGTPLSTHMQCPVDGCQFRSSKGGALKVHILQHYGIRPFKHLRLDTVTDLTPGICSPHCMKGSTKTETLEYLWP